MKKIAIISALFLALNAMAQSPQKMDSTCFSKHFLETKVIYGPGDSDPEHVMMNIALGFGVQYTYLPNRWGWYGGVSYIFGPKQDYTGLTGGAVYRILDATHKIDLQAYSGLSCGLGYSSNLFIKPGLDAGFRIAPGAKAGRSKFAWTSFSIGRTHFYDKPVYTVGFSISLSAIPAATALLLSFL